MTRHITVGLLMSAAMLAAVPSAFAQRWGREITPRTGACFYEDINFRGRYFCTPAGRDIPNLPREMNDKISSIQLFGNAQVTMFRDPRFNGQSRTIGNDVADLRRMNFNDRISSYAVDVDRRNVRGRDRRDDRWDPRADNRGNGRRDPRDDDRRGGAVQRFPGNGQVNNSRWSYREAQNIVRAAYRSVLRRDPDASGMRNWTQQVMANNWTQRDLENQLRRSDEYRQMTRTTVRRR